MKQNIYDDPQFFEMYRKLRETKMTYNDFLEQPALKRLLSDLRGKKILDIGCGFGDFAKFCVDEGAESVTGIDISENMLAQAKQHPRITYMHCAIEDVELPEDSYDIAVSSLAFHYVEDLNSLIQRISLWLRPAGELIFSTEHPIVTASLAQLEWVTDGDNNELYWPVDNYGEEGRREQFWGVEGVVKYHRKLSTLMNVLIDNGLQINRVVEPEPIAGGIEKKPSLKNERKRPSFILVKASKK